MRLSGVALEEGVPVLSPDDFTCTLKLEMSKMAMGDGREEQARKNE